MMGMAGLRVHPQDDRAGLECADGIVALIEDSPEDAGAFCRVFSEYGDVVVWSSGERALEAVTGDGPALHELSMLVVDASLPGIDGIEVVRRIRQMPGGIRAAVFVLSGSTDPETERRALAAGADEYIVKPRDLAGLREVAAHLVSATYDDPLS